MGGGLIREGVLYAGFYGISVCGRRDSVAWLQCVSANEPLQAILAWLWKLRILNFGGILPWAMISTPSLGSGFLCGYVWKRKIFLVLVFVWLLHWSHGCPHPRAQGKQNCSWGDQFLVYIHGWYCPPSPEVLNNNRERKGQLLRLWRVGQQPTPQAEEPQDATMAKTFHKPRLPSLSVWSPGFVRPSTSSQQESANKGALTSQFTQIVVKMNHQICIFWTGLRAAHTSQKTGTSLPVFNSNCLWWEVWCPVEEKLSDSVEKVLNTTQNFALSDNTISFARRKLSSTAVLYWLDSFSGAWKQIHLLSGQSVHNKVCPCHPTELCT